MRKKISPPPYLSFALPASFLPFHEGYLLPLFVWIRFFGGSTFFPSFVLVRFLWALRKLECFFILKFVREMKADIRCACPLKWPKKWESQKEIILFLICCLLWIYPSGKKQIGKRNSLPNFFPKEANGASVLHRLFTVSTRLSELRYGH